MGCSKRWVRGLHLYRIVLGQAFISVVLGFVLGFALTLALVVVVPIIAGNIALDVTSASLLKVGAVSLVITSLSAVLPIWQIARLDPALVFRGR